MNSLSLENTNKSRPKGAAFIALIQMWESFSFFGMRALLVLYLVSQIGYSTKDAFVLYTLYIAFVKIFAAAGGYFVDRWLGYSRAVLLGGTLIAAGHLLLTFSSLPILFFLSLGSIVCGSALFRVSLQALLGLLYEKEDPRREEGFTFFYVGMNLGGLLAAVICGFVAKIYGWHAGFGLAALGMIAALLVFISQLKRFASLEKAKKASPFLVFLSSLIGVICVGALLSHFEGMRYFSLPLGLIAFVYILGQLGRKMDKRVLFAVSGSLLLLVAFSTVEELWGSLLMVFSQTHIDRMVGGFEIPSAAIAAMNPLTIILIGPFVARRQIRFGIKLACAFLFLAVAFFVLFVASMIPHAGLFYLLIGLGCIAVGELFLTPTVYAFASKSAPQGNAGMMMGATTVALSMGSLLSGEVASISFDARITFFAIGAASLILFALLLWLSPKWNYNTDG